MLSPDQVSETKDAEKQVVKVYLLAAPSDEDQCEAVKVHLSPIIRNSDIDVVVQSDFDIPPGADKSEYMNDLFQADIVLAFISADFINNNDTYRRTQRVIERHNQNQTILFPILVRNCLWKSTPFVNLTLLPKNLQPLNNKQYWNSEDDALVEVVSDIYEAIQDFVVVENHLPGDQKPESGDTQGGQVQAINKMWRKGYYWKALRKRAGAILIDALVTIPIFALISSITTTLGLELGKMNPDSYGKLFDSSLYFGVPLLVLIILFAILESSKYQGTPGKVLMNLHTLDRKGRAISFHRALGRNFLRILLGNLWLMEIVDLYIQQIDTRILQEGEVYTFEFYHYLIVSAPFLLAQAIYFFVTNSMIHDRLAGTVVGEKV